MAEEIKEVEETTDLDAASEEESLNTEESSEEESVETREDDESTATEAEDFHKTELEKVKKKLGDKLDKERAKRIEAEKKPAVSPEDIERIVEKKVAEAERKLYAGRISQLLSDGTASPEERELAEHHLKNSIVSTGNIEEDVENAIALANKHKVKSRISELQVTARSKATRSGGSGAGAKLDKPRFTAEELEIARKFGAKPEEMFKNK